MIVIITLVSLFWVKYCAKDSPSLSVKFKKRNFSGQKDPNPSLLLTPAKPPAQAMQLGWAKLTQMHQSGA